MDVAEAVLEDVGEADEDGQADAAELQAIDELLQVDRARRVLGRVHLHVAGAVDGEVAVAPARHFVELAGVVHAPGASSRCLRSAESPRASIGHRAHLSVHDNRFSACRFRFRIGSSAPKLSSEGG